MEPTQARPSRVPSWRQRLVQAMLGLWVLQLAVVGWHFAPEAPDLLTRLVHGTGGEAVRLEDPYYRWLKSLAGFMPANSVFVFLDHYEAGKEIAARYHLFPRRHVMLPPATPPSFLFYALRQEGVGYILQRDRSLPPGPGLKAALDAGLAQPVDFPGPGLLFRVSSSGPHGAFYD